MYMYMHHTVLYRVNMINKKRNKTISAYVFFAKVVY
jgi:hypothetical protein